MGNGAESLRSALADRYRIGQMLGAGGMATVYLAQDMKHDRKVAIKVLRAELAAVIGAERFLAEIKTTANLQHPHILPLHDSGEAAKGGSDGGSYLYYVMPYIEGESLRDRLNREKQLPIADAVRIAGEVASALDYAHRHGVIHRDIKPENILLHDGRALVADFGIALAASRAGSTRMTETGMSLGTPHYMSPEQAMGEREIGPQSDVYALGAVTYEMLVGEPPFTGPTAQSIVAKVVTEEPRPLVPKRHTIPPHVEAAVLTALEKLPADRFATAKELADALSSQGYSRTVPILAASTRDSRRWRGVAAGAGMLAVAGIALGVAGFLRPAVPPAAVARYTLSFPDSQTPVIGALSRDGSHFVYVGPGPDNAGQQLWVKDRNRFDATPLAGTTNPQGYTISPDGKSVAFVQNAVLKRMPIGGGTPIVLADSAFFSGVAWLDDGTLVYCSTTFALTRISENGGVETRLWKYPHTPVLAPAMMTPLPGGRGVLFTACNGNCSTADLYVFDLKSGSARQLMPDVMQGWYLPTGHLTYVNRKGEMMAVPFDLDRLQMRGDPVPVLSGISLLIGIVPAVTISSSGTLIMQTGTGSAGEMAMSELVWVDRAGLRTVVDSGWTFRLSEVSGNNGWSISPDGKRVAIALTTSAGDDIWIKQLPAGPLSRLTFDSTQEQRPRWTPDGRFVTYVNSIGSVSQRRADGTGGEQVLLTMSQLILEASRTRNGWLIVRTGGQANARGGRDILGVPPGADTTVQPLVANSGYDEAAAAVSPDGKWLAYESDETGSNEVYIRPFPNTEGGKWQVSVNGGQAPLWAHSGRELFYVDAGRTMVAVPVAGGTTPGLGQHRALFQLGNDVYLGNPEHYTPFDISPDDRRFLLARQARAATAGRPGAFVLVENWFEELKAQVGGKR